MAIATDEGSIPCLHALAMALHERAKILGAQAEYIVDNTLGSRPHPQERKAPSSLYDLLADALHELHHVHDDYEMVARHIHPSDDAMRAPHHRSLDRPRGRVHPDRGHRAARRLLLVHPHLLRLRPRLPGQLFVLHG